MRRRSTVIEHIAGTAVLLGFAAALILPEHIFADDIAGILPDNTLTPGVIASNDEAEVCGRVGGITYSGRHRLTTPEMKDEVRRRYSRTRCGEVDHRLPLALGGADDIRNLWCEPGPVEAIWNYELKDKLETYVWAAVCKHHTLSLAEGQDIFLDEQDWRTAYCQYIGGAPCK